MPTKTRYVNLIKKHAASGGEVSDLFAVVRKTLATSARGLPYLRLTLGDKTGTIDGFVWDNAADYEKWLHEGDIVRVDARPQVHQGTPQLRVDRIRALSEKEAAGVDGAEFRPGLDLSTRERLWAELVGILDTVESPALRSLLEQFSREEGFRAAFLEGTAAKTFHHAYVGGLVEHTVAVLRLAQSVWERYPTRLNRDLLLTGAFLHDVAKVLEFDPKTGDYTDEGRLLGHITLGVRMIRDRAARVPGFPPQLLTQLEHLVLSHHDRPEWGSPVQPQTMEAIALHFLDNLDAKLSGVWARLEEEEVAQGGWSSYWRGLGVQLMRTPRLEGTGTREGDGGFGDIEDALLRMEGEQEAVDDLDGAAERRSEAGSKGREGGAKKDGKVPGQGTLGF